MSRKVQRMSSTLRIGENTAYTNWIKQKDEEKLKLEQMNMYEENKKKIEKRIEEEKRRVLNEICYWKWLEKKTAELKERKMIEEEKERRQKEMEILEKRDQMVKDIKFNEWLEKKILEEKLRRQQMLMEKQEKDSENEMKKYEKEQAKFIWKLWLENKNKKIVEEKLKKEKDEQEKEREKEEKRKLSEEKFQEWMAKAATRPRPVKNNLGFTSLSCSNIGFINPEPWKNILDYKINSDDNIGDYDRMFTLLYKQQSNVNFNNSNTTIKTFEGCCNNTVLQRTADWVKYSTENSYEETKLNNDVNNKPVTMDKFQLIKKKNVHNNKNNIVRLDRNKSLPVFLNGQH